MSTKVKKSNRNLATQLLKEEIKFLGEESRQLRIREKATDSLKRSDLRSDLNYERTYTRRINLRALHLAYSYLRGDLGKGEKDLSTVPHEIQGKAMRILKDNFSKVFESLNKK